MKLPLLVLGLALTTASALAVQPVTSGMYPNGIQGGITAQEIPRVNSLPTAQYLRHQRQVAALNALRREAALLQQQDGGTLTPAHRAQLQAKLEAINAWQTNARN
ncbi:MAG: hypothetical protein P4L57_04930 [Rhizomicrobium sp.]|nr:hypothetical protein [Rhizomicrobium sp.]